jgi:hypothetical protein
VTSPSSTPTSAPSAAHASTSAPLAPSSDPTSGHGLVASHARNTFPLPFFLTVPFVSSLASFTPSSTGKSYADCENRMRQLWLPSCSRADENSCSGNMLHRPRPSFSSGRWRSIGTNLNTVLLLISSKYFRYGQY